MFKFFKLLHFVGLTLFLGSIWVYIAQGTPMESVIIMQYVRENVFRLIEILTFPGLVLMVFSGLGMVLSRREIMKKRFFKIKLIFSVLLLINTRHILTLAHQSAMLLKTPVWSSDVLINLLNKEAFFGAINVAIILSLITYSIFYKRSQKNQ